MKTQDLIREGFQVLLSFLSRVVFYPFVLAIPRSSDMILVVGREGGKFLDNSKYFFIYGERELGSKNIIYLTKYTGVYEDLLKLGKHVTKFPSFRSLWYLMRAGVIVVDSMDYIDSGRIGLIQGASIVQIWHGVPLKHIELSLHETRLNRLPAFKRALLVLAKKIVGRYQKTDFLVSTSVFTRDEVFSKCFSAKNIINVGYPRNDVLYDDRSSHDDLVMLNVDGPALERVKSHRMGGGKVVIYAPTFRGDARARSCPLNIDINQIDSFCRSSNIVFVLKLHPVVEQPELSAVSDNLVVVDPSTDIYPILSEADALITDYSSIYFDFLHVNKPIIFYCYDVERYQAGDRRFYFDYDDVTPGVKVYNHNDMLKQLKWILLEGVDEFRVEREGLAQVVFDDLDGASTQRIARYIGNIEKT